LAARAPAPDAFFERAAALRAETRGTAQNDSAELLRADRDRDLSVIRRHEVYRNSASSRAGLAAPVSLANPTIG